MNEAAEKWRECEYDTRYRVSNMGRVSGVSRDILKPYLHGPKKYPYYSVAIRGKNFRVHRLVAVAFVANPDNRKQVNHLDGDRFNNRANNLEWCNALENIRHAFDNGFNLGAPCGERNGSSVLDAESVVEIRRRLSVGERPTKLARAFGVGGTTIHHIQYGITWRHLLP